MSLVAFPKAGAAVRDAVARVDLAVEPVLVAVRPAVLATAHDALVVQVATRSGADQRARPTGGIVAAVARDLERNAESASVLVFADFLVFGATQRRITRRSAAGP